MKITENMDFIFIDFFGEHYNMSDKREIKFKKYLKITFNTPVHFKELLSSSCYFLNLLEVCLLKRTTFTMHRLTFEDGAYPHVVDNIYEISKKSSKVLNYSLNKGQKVVDGFFHQNDMLISKWKFSEDALDNVIRLWYANRNYSHIYDYFIDSHHWKIGEDLFLTNVMFNNRFLNMLHGIEGFHELFYGRAKYENTIFEFNKGEALKLIKNPHLKQWLNNNLNPPKHNYQSLKNKLNHLIDEFEPFFKLRFGSNMVVTKEFFLRAAKYRNILSHGLQKSTYQGEEFNKLFLAIQYLLTFCILKSLNIDSVKKTIEFNYTLDYSTNEIILFINDHIDDYRDTNN